MIRNPILPGFNPDPSICRVGEEYYIATSTFEWYPGVQIHHSRDLINWTLVARPLNRASQLDMRGNPDSCGIWAPCLSHADGLFWLIYTDVKRLDGNFKDTHNYLVTSSSIDGNWTDPVHVNSSGFDPSLFHDDDGRKWFLNLRWNHRGSGTGGNPAHDSFDGILLQEYRHGEGLTGEAEVISHGSGLGLTEGAHMFKRNGYYYLTVAEGGTGYDHAVTMARAREIGGPYELHPGPHLITTKDAPDHPIQRTGHGQYVETTTGEVYHTFLMGRPIAGQNGDARFCPRGRETGIERCVWENDWLYLEGGGTLPRETLEGLTDSPAPAPTAVHYDFADALPMDFQWLRSPEPDRLFTLTESALRLFGRESLGSWFEQSLVARRQEHASYKAATKITDFAPVTYQQAAGLVTYYNRHKFHAVLVSHDDALGRVLCILSCPGDYPEGRMEVLATVPVAPGTIDLAVSVDHANQHFLFRQDGEWKKIGPVLDAAIISDEGGRGEHASFTGAFVGMVAFDLTGQACPADFSGFSYEPH